MPIEYKPESAFYKPYCPRGHYKPEVGVSASGSWCHGCYVESEAKRDQSRIVFKPKSAFRRPWCKRGHYKPEVGVAGSRCCACKKKRDLDAYYMKKHGEIPPPLQSIYRQCEEVRLLCGMDKKTFCEEVGIGRRTYDTWKNGVKANGIIIKRVVPVLYRLKREQEEVERIRQLREEASRPNLQRPFNEAKPEAA